LRPGDGGDIIIRMQTGNGIDLNAVYQLLREVAHRVQSIETRLDGHERRLDGVARRQDDQTGKLNELISVVNSHSGRFDRLEAVLSEHGRKIDDLNAGITELRKSVSNYHDAAVGHGIWITEINGRLDRIERHLGLEPIPAVR
jgi:chromosome segregation ATPase